MSEVGSIGPTRVLEARAIRPGYVKVPGVSDFKIKGVPGSNNLDLVLGDSVLVELMVRDGREHVVGVYAADGKQPNGQGRQAGTKINARA